MEKNKGIEMSKTFTISCYRHQLGERWQVSLVWMPLKPPLSGNRSLTVIIWATWVWRLWVWSWGGGGVSAHGCPDVLSGIEIRWFGWMWLILGLLSKPRLHETTRVAPRAVFLDEVKCLRFGEHRGSHWWSKHLVQGVYKLHLCLK